MALLAVATIPAFASGDQNGGPETFNMTGTIVSLEADCCWRVSHAETANATKWKIMLEIDDHLPTNPGFGVIRENIM